MSICFYYNNADFVIKAVIFGKDADTGPFGIQIRHKLIYLSLIAPFLIKGWALLKVLEPKNCIVYLSL